MAQSGNAPQRAQGSGFACEARCWGNLESETYDARTHTATGHYLCDYQAHRFQMTFNVVTQEKKMGKVEQIAVEKTVSKDGEVILGAGNSYQPNGEIEEY